MLPCRGPAQMITGLTVTGKQQGTMNRAMEVDIVIIGGGIAGLWLLNRLRAEGHAAIVLEADALGGGQTLASQGIIHGGLKYALNGRLSPASSAIAGMPARWRKAMAGEDAVDLRGCRLLSPHYYMWSGGSLRSRLKTFLGSRALRGRIDPVAPAEQPAFLRDSARPGRLYQLEDFVVDTPDLLRRLGSLQSRAIFRGADIRLHSIDHNRIQVELSGKTGKVQLDTTTLLLCAGAGNASLLQQLGQETPAMQRRPLHMVCVKGRKLPEAFLHCIGEDFGMTPKITISTHPAPDGSRYWYLGGELAESGLALEPAEQQQRAASWLQQLFPGIDFSDAQWSSFFIDRAEPATTDGRRPDSAYVHEEGPLITCWPSKLTLCPDLGDQVIDCLSRRQLSTDQPQGDITALDSLLHRPELASAPWEELLP